MFALVHVKFTPYRRCLNVVASIFKFLLFLLILWPIEAVFWLAFLVIATVVTIVVRVFTYCILHLIFRK